MDFPRKNEHGYHTEVSKKSNDRYLSQVIGLTDSFWDYWT
ncbi:hypothetical protein LEP1GSC097_0344 [Leptospira interrogans serovar Grippotyphosa str. UI 08368]|nr:hypothetical protein LEP1GSC097_0344 [Leptospira interrogans serovar Grippotyphosa str. UI 08368]